MKQAQHEQQHAHEQLQNSVKQMRLENHHQTEAQTAHSGQHAQIVGTGACVSMPDGNHDEIDDGRQNE